MFGILALRMFSAGILMNPQDEVLRKESMYVLYRKAQFSICKLKREKLN